VAVYRCIAADLVTGQRITELPLNGLSYGARLNDVGQASARLPFPAPSTATNRAVAALLNDAVDEARRMLIIERDGVIVWCGIIWVAAYNDGDQSRDIRASDHGSYWRRRLVTYNQTFTASTATTIAQTVLTTAQAAPGGNLNVNVIREIDPAFTEPSVTLELDRYELRTVGEVIEDLAKADGGFEYDYSYTWNGGGTVSKTLTLSYPRRGRNFQRSGHVFEVGRNVTEFSWPSDGTRVANKVYATGNGEGDAMLISSAADTFQILPGSAGGPGYPLLEEVVSSKRTRGTDGQAQLDALTAGRIKAVATPVVLPEITVRADLDPVFGSYITGDACRIIIPPNLSPRFPDGFDQYRRIVGWNVRVDDDGTEAVTLILGDEPN
jgi:hypothetical protein